MPFRTSSEKFLPPYVFSATHDGLNDQPLRFEGAIPFDTATFPFPLWQQRLRLGQKSAPAVEGLNELDAVKHRRVSVRSKPVRHRLGD
jgi:hypothetical protein